MKLGIQLIWAIVQERNNKSWDEEGEETVPFVFFFFFLSAMEENSINWVHLT